MQKSDNKERGNVVIVTMLILLALVSLGGLTTLSVQGGMASTGHDRFRSIALYAAESGAAVGMEFLRSNMDANTYWTVWVNPNNLEPLQAPDGIAGNGIRSGQPGNLFNEKMRAWYEVEIVNNLDDPGLALGEDQDARVIIRSTGHGPNGTVARIEWEVLQSDAVGLGRPCPSYAQQGIDADGAGLNDCMGTITGGMTVYSVNTP